MLLTWQAHYDEIERVRSALPAEAEVIAHGEVPPFSRFDASYEDLGEEARHADILMGFCLPPGTSWAMLSGRTLLVIGLGKIGLAIAKFASAFDIHVMAIRRHLGRGGDHVDSVKGPDELLDLLPRVDYAMLATSTTGECELAAMKTTDLLINIARGNLTKEVPLHQALTSAGIAGYAADVWSDYGMVFSETRYFQCPTRTGYHKLLNVPGTGDQAANAENVLERHIDQGIESIQQLIRGQPLSWKVDLELGY